MIVSLCDVTASCFMCCITSSKGQMSYSEDSLNLGNSTMWQWSRLMIRFNNHWQHPKAWCHCSKITDASRWMSRGCSLNNNNLSLTFVVIMLQVFSLQFIHHLVFTAVISSRPLQPSICSVLKRRCISDNGRIGASMDQSGLKTSPKDIFGEICFQIIK